jgi:hypothetical protein
VGWIRASRLHFFGAKAKMRLQSDQTALRKFDLKVGNKQIAVL